jgi:hypothetical protein
MSSSEIESDNENASNTPNGSFSCSKVKKLLITYFKNNKFQT